MPGMTKTNYLIQTTYNLIIRRPITSNGKGSGKTVRANYYFIKPCAEDWKSNHNSCRQYSRLHLGHSRLTLRHLITINDQQPTCKNAVCRNQRLTIKHYLQECPDEETTEKKIISRAI